MFEHMSSLQVDPKATAWIDLPDIAPNARVCLRHAGEPNKPYFNALLTISAPRTKQKRARSGGIDVNAIGQNREDDQSLYAAHVLTGWEGIQTQNADGEWEDVPFNKKNALEFCQQLPGWLFDQIREFSSDLSNYLAEGDKVPPDPDDITGN